MRVLMLGWEFAPERTGGVGTACQGIAEALVRAGVELTVVAPCGGFETLEEAEGLRVLATSKNSLASTSIPNPHPPGEDSTKSAVVSQKGRDSEPVPMLPIASPLTPYLTRASYSGRPPLHPAAGVYATGLLGEVQRFASEAVRVTRALSVDVLHAHDWMTLPAASRIASLSKLPLVWHVHSTEYDRAPSAPDPAVVAIEQRGLDRAERVIAVSRTTRELLRERYRVDPSKLRVVHNAVTQPTGSDDASRRTSRDPARPLVLFLGRLAEQKDPMTFLRAAARAALAVPAARFVVAGSGDLLPDLIAETAKLGLQSRVHFTGLLRGKDVERMYALADVYVMPSIAEPFGISALEAMCADVPVIVSRTSGVAEILSNALKVDVQDVDGLADKMISLLLRPALRKTLAQQGREEVRTLRWDVRAQALLAVFRELSA